jgi:hypothetical protein
MKNSNDTIGNRSRDLRKPVVPYLTWRAANCTQNQSANANTAVIRRRTLGVLVYWMLEFRRTVMMCAACDVSILRGKGGGGAPTHLAPVYDSILSHWTQNHMYICQFYSVHTILYKLNQQ